ncbi:uncharacterized protein LOC121047753 [Ixodes scapularis]|uniref:uncharacterized protein LOC121047753 n=1 Tax=Ixodes scapularis TaxID=6945 RepID=UPI001C386C4B|nr:uncharacterized protein LOC121047753 [Ixodes scapularis]
MLKVQTLCAKNHCLLWRSQPVMNGKAAGNVLVSAGILFTGASPTSVLRTLEHINIQVFTLRTFYNYQRGYLLPAINKIWREQQEELFLQLEGQEVDLAGDGRCDSPGFSAKYMTYSLHAAQLNKILHFEQVQVGECAEVKSSTSMEKHAFLKCLEKVKDRRLSVVSMTTDRHIQVAKHMRTEEPTIRHYFDGWHISKGIKKKLAAQAKRAGCSVLEVWIQPASNHLFWCAALSDGNQELLLDMWKSVQYHVANKHADHPGLYTHCAHEDIGEREWLVPGTRAHDKFVEVTMAPRLLKDIRQLAPSTHTFSLEAFHSVLIGTQLAILHFNENANTEQAVSADGSLQFKIKHPKSRKGVKVVRPKQAEPTYSK